MSDTNPMYAVNGSRFILEKLPDDTIIIWDTVREEMREEWEDAGSPSCQSPPCPAVAVGLPEEEAFDWLKEALGVEGEHIPVTRVNEKGEHAVYESNRESLTSAELLVLRRVVREQDIDLGGYYDVRSGALNFWSGPENCPVGQENLSYVKGALMFPRNFIGTVTLSDLSVETINYELLRSEHGEISCGPLVESYRNLPEDVAWVRKQWKALWEDSLGLPPPELTLKE